MSVPLDPSEPSTDPGYSIEELNSILRGEIAAVETYSRALLTGPRSALSDILQTIRSDHLKAILLLRSRLYELGGTPVRDSGLWGSLANGVQSVTSNAGERFMVWSLLRGEVFGRQWYEDLLEDRFLLQQCKLTIRDFLMPMSSSHVLRLKRIPVVTFADADTSLPPNRKPKHQTV